MDEVCCCLPHPGEDYTGENRSHGKNDDCGYQGVGTIEMVMRKFNIDPDASFMICRWERDLLCGRDSGLATVGLRTGSSKDFPGVRPEYFFDNLLDAINFLIDDPFRSYYEQIMVEMEGKDKKPFVLAVGGNTCSGKSTLARYLFDKFKGMSKRVMIISLDDWILPKDERKREFNVFERFQIGKINKNIAEILGGEKISISKYDSLTRGREEEDRSYKNEDVDIIIIEGVVALSSGVIRDKADISIFCEIDEEVLLRRIIAYNAWRGLDEDEVREIIEQRKEDEYRIIAGDKRHADIVIPPGG